MTQLCIRCGRTNPKGAAYCYFDGIGLHTVIEPLASPGRLDPPFYFPDGRNCKSFDELALACQSELKEAQGILLAGDFTIYFRRLSRLDLTALSERARKNLNADLALEEFLLGLPSKALQEPELKIDSQKITLGKLQPGVNKDLQISLRNAGQGLLKGRAKVISNDFWLTLGDGKSANQKYFQFWDQGSIHLQAVGHKIHASEKPLSGKIILETNGGNLEIEVAALAPIAPFPHGCLQSATTPRMVAKMAKLAPQEAARLFETGEVQKWYEINGWVYPMTGPPASGVAAIQQFYEALGLTEPPKVSIDNLSLRCAAYPGERKILEVLVSTREKRHVYAQATPTVPWIRCQPTESKGNAAAIPLELDIPLNAGQDLEGGVRVVSNGGAKFLVSVRVTLTPPPPGVIPVVQTEKLGNLKAALLSLDPSMGIEVVAPPPVTQSNPGVSLPPISKGAKSTFHSGLVQTPPTIPFAELAKESLEEEQGFPYAGMAMVLGVLLLLGNLLAIGRDAYSSQGRGKENIEVVSQPEDLPDEMPNDLEPRLRFALGEEPITWNLVESLKPERGQPNTKGLQVRSDPHHSFGLFGIVKGDAGHEGSKKLFFDDGGYTNNTILRVDGTDWFFGQGEFRPVIPAQRKALQKFFDNKNTHRQGRWIGPTESLPPSTKPFLGLGHASTWLQPKQQIETKQTVRIVPGQQSGLLDTCLVIYQVTNRGNREREVGIRTMLDTFIGSNDGVPFLIPGEEVLCTTSKIMERKAIPDFLQACERADLKNPGTIATLGIHIPGFERPGKVTLGAWPNSSLGDPRAAGIDTLWDVPVKDIHEINREGDSAVTLYWEPRTLKPGESFKAAYTYGLGTISAQEGGGELALTAGGNFTPGGEFTLTAYISGHSSSDQLTLALPPGFTLIDGKVETPLRDSTSKQAITWKVKAPTKETDGLFSATTTRKIKQSLNIRIRKVTAGGIFG